MYVGIVEAAAYCDLTEESLRRWTESGHAPHYFIDGRGPYYRKTILKKWVEENLMQINAGMPVPQTLPVLTAVTQSDNGDSDIPFPLCAINNLLRVAIGAAQSGIYFLCSGPDVVYVGQSTSVLSRLCTHVAHGRKTFDLGRVFFLACPPHDLVRVERHWINTLRPKYNLCAPTGNERAWMRIEHDALPS